MANVDFNLVSGVVSVTLPGGLVLSSAPVSPVPTEGEAARVLLGQLSGALAPFTAVLQIVGFVKSVMDLATAIPAALGPPPNPGKLATAIGEVLEKGDVVLAFSPVTSIPVLFAGVVDLFRVMVSGLQAEVDALARQQESADDARALSESLEEPAKGEMIAVADCGDQVVTETLAGLQASLGGMTTITDAMTVLSTIVPVAGLPVLDLGESVESAQVALDAFAELLDAIPV